MIYSRCICNILYRYRWAFIGGAAAGEVEEEIDNSEEEKKKKSWARQTSFKPHIIRLAKLLNAKVKSPG